MKLSAHQRQIGKQLEVGRWGFGFLPGFSNPPFSPSQFSSGERAGFIYGGGIEVMATRQLVARAEVMFADFGTSTASFFSPVAVGVRGGLFNTNFKNDATIGRLALSWKW